ncbi:MAG: peptidylprolyl isomerase [Deltaproteobacteria bacterium]|nr:peptidylprolyl isomerase [Deltaproteobacteria bacterium]
MDNTFRFLFVVIGILPLLMPLPAGAAQPGVLDAVAIVVNDEPILLSDIRETREQELTKFRMLNPGVPEAELRRALGDGMSRAADELIRLVLVDQDARRYGMAVTDFEVDEAIERLQSGRGLTREQLQAEAKAQGLTWDRYRREVRYAILFDRLKMSLLRPRVSVSEAEIKAYYDASYRKSAEEARVQMLFLPFADPADAKGRVRTMERAVSLKGEAEKTGDFAAIVRQHSSGPNASRGGDIGVVRRGSILPFLEAAIFSTPKGQISDPVTDERGVYLLKVLDRSGSESQPLDAVFSQIKGALENQKTDEAFEHYIEDLVAGARIERHELPGL